MKRIVITILSVLSFVQAHAQGQFTIEVPGVVATGERFRLVFTATDLPHETFHPPQIQNFTVLAGPTTSTMNRMEYINGRRTQSRSISYTYILEAREPGKFTIDEASIVSDNVTYKTRPVTVEVIQSADKAVRERKEEPATATASIADEDVFLRLSVSKSRVVKGEPLTATLKLYTRVNVAGAEDVRFPEFNGFWSQEVYAPHQIEWQRENVGGEIYQTATLRSYVLLPQQTGNIRIDPSEIVCVIQVRNTRRGQSLLDEFFDTYQTVRKRVVAPPVTVTVRDLPVGAPASFKGAVGKYSLQTMLGKDSVSAHDAVSLYVTITGEGNINLLETPVVQFPPDFEVYDAKITDNFRSTEGTFSGSKTFEYPVIPRSHGAFTISPVEFTYYDIAARQYKTLRSNPLVIEVSKSTEIGVYTGMYPPTAHRRSVESLGQDIRYIYTSRPVWNKKGSCYTGSMYYYLALFAILVGSGMAYLGLNKRRERRSDAVRVRNSRANKVARARLKTAGEYMKQQRFEGYYEELNRALWGYIADKLALSQADSSRERIEEILRERQVDESLIDDYTRLIESCEFARYAPDPGQLEKERIFERAVTVISKMEQALK
ncbi:MAG: protein BatD [Bacteroidales bacterium]|nr:protein BatD [Bacteroidales bacterium]